MSTDHHHLDENAFMVETNNQHHHLHRESSLIISKLSASEKLLEKLAQFDSKVKRFKYDDGVEDQKSDDHNGLHDDDDEVPPEGIPKGAVPPSGHLILKHLHLPGTIIDIIGLETILSTRNIRVVEDLGYSDIKHLYKALLDEVSNMGDIHGDLLDLEKLFKVSDTHKENNNSTNDDHHDIQFMTDEYLASDRAGQKMMMMLCTVYDDNMIMKGLAGDDGGGNESSMVNARDRKKVKLNALNAIRISYLQHGKNVNNVDVIKGILKLLALDSDTAVTLSALSALEAVPKEEGHWVEEGIASYLSRPTITSRDATSDELKCVLSNIMNIHLEAVLEGCYKSMESRMKTVDKKKRKMMKWIPYQLITAHLDPHTTSSKLMDIAMALLRVDATFDEGSITRLRESAEEELIRLGESDVVHGA